MSIKSLTIEQRKGLKKHLVQAVYLAALRKQFIDRFNQSPI